MVRGTDWLGLVFVVGAVASADLCLLQLSVRTLSLAKLSKESIHQQMKEFSELN